MMNIDEAILHSEEVAERYERMEDSQDDKLKEECLQCASDHRQLAAWLRELKELRLTVGMIKVEDLKSALTLLWEYKAENNEMRERIERLDSENYKLTEKLEEIGTAFNEQVSLVGWHEEREKEYKRLLKAAVDDFHWLAEWRDKCALCGSRNVEGDCAVVGGADCDEVYTWRHEAEALERIGKENETEDRTV